MKIWRAIPFGACIMLLVLWGTLALARPPASREIALALEKTSPESSGEWERTGVDSLKTLIELMDARDKLSILSFDRQVNVLQPRRQMEAAAKKASIKLLSTLSDSQPGCDLERLLNRALFQFSGKEGMERSLLLVTTGRIDLDGDPEQLSVEEENSRKRILSEVLQRFKKRGIRLFAIAKSDTADAELLRTFCLNSNGLYFPAQSKQEIAKAAFRIFTRIQELQFAPVENGRFVLDKSVKNATVVIAGSEQRPKLRASRFKGSHRKKRNTKARWSGNSAFTLASISSPAPVAWHVDGASPDSVYVILNSDVNLDVPFSRSVYLQNEPIPLLARLDFMGKPSDSSIRPTLSAELHNWQGKRLRSATLTDSGSTTGACDSDAADRWAGNYAAALLADSTPLKEGLYQIRVLAKGDAFGRERHFSIQVVAGSWVQISPQKANEDKLQWDLQITNDLLDGPLNAEGRVTQPNLNPEKPVQISITSPSGKVIPAELTALGDGRYRASLSQPSEAGEYQLSIKGNLGIDALVCLNLASTQTITISKNDLAGLKKEETEERSFPVAEAVLFVVLLGMLGTMVVMWRRMQKATEKTGIIEVAYEYDSSEDAFDMDIPSLDEDELMDEASEGIAFIEDRAKASAEALRGKPLTVSDAFPLADDDEIVDGPAAKEPELPEAPDGILNMSWGFEELSLQDAPTVDALADQASGQPSMKELEASLSMAEDALNQPEVEQEEPEPEDQEAAEMEAESEEEADAEAESTVEEEEERYSFKRARREKESGEMDLDEIDSILNQMESFAGIEPEEVEEQAVEAEEESTFSGLQRGLDIDDMERPPVDAADIPDFEAEAETEAAEEEIEQEEKPVSAQDELEALMADLQKGNVAASESQPEEAVEETVEEEEDTEEPVPAISEPQESPQEKASAQNELDDLMAELSQMNVKKEEAPATPAQPEEEAISEPEEEEPELSDDEKAAIEEMATEAENIKQQIEQNVEEITEMVAAINEAGIESYNEQVKERLSEARSISTSAVVAVEQVRLSGSEDEATWMMGEVEQALQKVSRLLEDVEHIRAEAVKEQDKQAMEQLISDMEESTKGQGKIIKPGKKKKDFGSVVEKK